MLAAPYIYESLDMLGIAACEYDASHRAVGWNRTFLQLFPEHEGAIAVGEPYEDNLRRFYRLRLAPEDLPEIERVVAEGVARHINQTRPFEFIHGGRRLRASSLPGPGGSRLRLWQVADPEARAPREAAPTMPVFEALDFIPDGATILDAQDRIVEANNAFRELYGIAFDEPIVGRTLDEIVAASWKGGSPAGALRALVRNSLRYDGSPFEIELPGQRWVRVMARHSEVGVGFFTHADITAAKRQQIQLLETQEALRQANAALAQRAETDALTGLANRRRFSEVLAEEARSARPLVLMMIDVDHFKAINDRFGHLVGDLCLRTIADVIRRVSPASALAARVGGEEFCILFGGMEIALAHESAIAIRLALSQVAWGGLHPELGGVTLSVGLCAGEGPLDGDHLYACADEALYAAKRKGRDRIERHELPSPPLKIAG